MTDWLEPGFHVETGVQPERPEWIVLTGHPGGRVPLRAALARIGSRSADYLFLVGLTDRVSQEEAARVLALALMDSKYNLLQPTLMPPRAPLAVLRSDGAFRHMMTRTFSAWILSEVDRIGDDLRRKKSEILNAATLALKGLESKTLEPVPADFPFTDNTNRSVALALGRLAEGVRWQDPPRPPAERHHHIRAEYERDRFLAHLSLAELLQRGKDIIRNVHQMDRFGRVTLDSKDPRLHHWIDRFTEYMHELSLRGMDPRVSAPQLLDQVPLPSEGDEWPKTVGAAIAAFPLPPRPILVRYDQLAHVRDMWERGVLRLGAASSYDDASLDPARRDDELGLALDVDASVLPFISGGDVRWNPESLRLMANLRLNSDFLVHCTSSSLRARLFLDFHRNAALVIRDVSEFRRRFERAARKTRPDWLLSAGSVTYYDPLNITPGEVQPPFWKHFRFAYQDEVRFVLAPPRPVASLQPLFLELGSLRDISDPIFPT